MEKFGLARLLGNKKGKTERRRQERIAHGPLSILVVDDSSTVVYALKKVLEQDGYQVLVASNGEQAIDMAEQHQADLILMDVIMPGMNGYQATRRIRKLPQYRETPIIIISASEQKTEEFWLRKLGASDFLAKPVLRGQLFPTIEKHLYSHVA
ncbi:MAG: response regulator [Thioalkalispiraceae bacterium]|jgi:twitching motility two-component system response regulator PilH